MASPGVTTRELSVFNSINTSPGSLGVFVGEFVRGYSDYPLSIFDKTDLESVLGEPVNSLSPLLNNTSNQNDFFQVENFLTYEGTSALVIRATGEGSKNANIELPKSQGSGDSYSDPDYVYDNYWDDSQGTTTIHGDITILNPTAKETYGVNFAGTSSLVQVVAKSVGVWGNDIHIAVVTKDDFINIPNTKIVRSFREVPKDGEVGIYVEYNDMVETFVGSLDPTAKTNGNRTFYIENIVNNRSSLIWLYVNQSAVSNFNSNPGTLENRQHQLEHGVYVAPSLANIIDNYQIFEDFEKYEINYIIQNEILESNLTCINLAEKIAEATTYIGAPYRVFSSRRDSQILDSLTNYVNNDLNRSTTYAVIEGNYILVYDKYNDEDIWVNIAGDTAGLRAETDITYGPYFASAGVNRGRSKNAKRLIWNPKKEIRDVLYTYNAINPWYNMRGVGNVRYGQMTKNVERDVRNREHVRSLFNYLKRNVRKFSYSFNFDFNDELTRRLFVLGVDPIFKSSGRGIMSYKIVCDESNNDATALDNNEFICDFYIKPTPVAEFIKLTFVGVNHQVGFDEVVGKLT